MHPDEPLGLERIGFAASALHLTESGARHSGIKEEIEARTNGLHKSSPDKKRRWLAIAGHPADLL
jgi:hypothetical protein